MAMRLFWVLLLVLPGIGHAANISNPTLFMFVADKDENFIDVLSLADAEVVYRIETSVHPDQVVVTPFAPILMYTNVETQKAVFFDLEEKVETNTIDLPLTPRHVVLDTTGAKVGISDDIEGGFVLIHLYKRAIEFSIEDFPATADVLFDPNDVDIYYSNDATGSLGLLDANTHRTYEMSIVDGGDAALSSPSRSLDARYVYVANESNGEVYSLNAYSKVIFDTFSIGSAPARPYTTPQGAFLYMMDTESGRFVSVEQSRFTEYSDSSFEHGINLVTVGRFDRMNLFLSSTHRHWYLFDNVSKSVVADGEFNGTPIGASGAADGKTAYVAFADRAEIAVVDLEGKDVKYVPATRNGSSGFTVGLSNNVCH